MSSERLQMVLKKLSKITKVDKERVKIARAPGRANIIGEHTDYNEGYVLPCTIDRDKELDIMVEIAEMVKGVVGCRITGAGLGGCAASLVWDWAVEELTKRVYDGYKGKTGIKPKVYVCRIPPGAGELLDWSESIEEVF